MLGDAKTKADLGQDFGADLTEREASWLIKKEFARSAEDIVWRRSKLGLRLTKQEIDRLDTWLDASLADAVAMPSVPTAV